MSFIDRMLGINRKKYDSLDASLDTYNGIAQNNNGHADPYQAADLVAHRHDIDNINLAFESISMPNGHAGTEVIYYAALRQVIVHNYSVTSTNPTSNVERIDIPVGIEGKSAILAYACERNFSVRLIAQQDPQGNNFNIPTLNPQREGDTLIVSKTRPDDFNDETRILK